mmetsp:Transcript_19128/g.47594  ORF Transcript_19128/g.47594 Transcript_19128/m.47594 type:complete len:419 (+) Transcript_19128:414-1670(+)|eukprot:CAMPEP_0116083018 /NCGR_PEP_ID=MMETSP0327-20121206/3044_1 /TAXON_ID=44447 /ORGANISM="Pseudo-nitzschia delicatissima, Strain B596" /LENGTH=418 /DNA_ID=CAMNT_0003573867 /DNA_START=215 /DNA_END=1471 /DNA_ORIENTATION=+
MKILKKNISAKDGSGSVMLRPDTPEDLWHSYNLLKKEDLVRCTTVRKVVKESSTGSTTSSKKRLMLTIRLRKIDFDPDALQVRLSGVVENQNELVRLGAHHTLTLELNQNFSIEKDCWDQIYLEILEEACNPERQAELAAIVMHSGLAHLCLVTGSLTITKARIETNIPKKRTGSSNNAKAITKFFEAIYQAILRHVEFSKVKAVLIGSPGYTKDDFFAYLKETCVKRDDRPIRDAVQQDKFVLVRASNGHKYALEEVFSDPAITKKIEDTKVVKEVAILNQFMRMMDTDPDKAYYGYSHVKSAADQCAIDSLLVTDQLFRASTPKVRRMYVDLVEDVRSNGGTVFIFSALHVSGQQLGQVSGVAAILRYPLPDLDELELEYEAAMMGEKAIEDSDSDSDIENDGYERVREDLELMNF